MKSGEIAIKVTLELPEALFRPPMLQASITVPDGSVSAPVINAEVVNNISQIVQDQLGCKLTIDQSEIEKHQTE